jgi:hypothetical protein
MKEQKTSLRITKYEDEPDAFLVVTDGSEPDALPVIPTGMAQSYWAHPSRIGTPAAA